MTSQSERKNLQTEREVVTESAWGASGEGIMNWVEATLVKRMCTEPLLTLDQILTHPSGSGGREDAGLCSRS